MKQNLGYLRYIFLLVGLLTLAVALGFAWQMPWATSLWPWPDGRLSYIFVGAIAAAIAAAVLWIGYSREWGAVAAGALNLAVMMGGMSIYFFQIARQPDRSHLLIYALGCGLFAIFNIGLLFWSRRLAIRDPRPTPLAVRLSYILFAVVLLAVGGALVLKRPNTMPWPLNPDTSVLFGWIFIGDAFYFIYSLLNPRWHNARAQLWSFLAYDVFLLPPLLMHFGPVLPENFLSLVVYTAILVYSAVLAIYYLVLNTRFRATIMFL
jgi:hypothetical protein